MNAKISLCLILFGLTINLFSQNANFKYIFLEAEYHFSTGNFKKALNYYENLYSKDPDNANLSFLCGVSCLKVEGGTPRTRTYLEKAVQHADPEYKEGSYKERNAPIESYFQMGKFHHLNNEFTEAIDYYVKCSNLIDKRKFANIEFVNAHIKAC